MFLRTFTENLMTYALGRRVEYYDMPTVRAIVSAAGANDYRMSAFILGIVNSPAFPMAKTRGAGADDRDPVGRVPRSGPNHRRPGPVDPA